MKENDFSAEFAKATATQVALLTRIEKATVDLGLAFSQARNDTAQGLVGGIHPYSIFRDGFKQSTGMTGKAIELPVNLNLIYHKVYLTVVLQSSGTTGSFFRGSVEFVNGNNGVFSVPVKVSDANQKSLSNKFQVDIAPLVGVAEDSILVTFNTALVPSAIACAPFKVTAAATNIFLQVDEMKIDDGGDPLFFFLGVKSSMIPF